MPIICGTGDSPRDLLDPRSPRFVAVPIPLDEVPQGFRNPDRRCIPKFSRAKAGRDINCKFGDFDPTKRLLLCQDLENCLKNS